MPVLKKPTTPATPRPGTTPTKPLSSTNTPNRTVPQGGGAKPKDSFAARFAAADPKEGGGFVPPTPGKYNAIIFDAVAERESEGIKETAYLEYTIHDPGEPMHSKAARIYYNFTKEDGTEGTGMPYFKAMLEMFGMPTEVESWEHMEEMLKELAEQEWWIIVDVKKKGAYTNSFIDSVPEDQSNKPTF